MCDKQTRKKMLEIDCCAACPFQGYNGAKPMCFKTKETLDSVDTPPPVSCPLPDKAGWLPIEAEDLAVTGYYWWLPECSSGNSDEPSNWTIIAWHPQDTSVARSGVFVGPIPSPPETME